MADAASDTDAARREAFGRHVLPEVEVLLRVAGSMTAQRADAEDLVQDTLLRAWRSIDTFDGAHPRAWLLTILRNAAVNRHRRRRPVLLDDPETADRDAPVDGGASAEDLVVGEMFDEAVQAAVRELPETFREVIVLVDVQGLGYTAAAEALGVPEGTVMSRLHRGRKRVRESLAAQGVVPRRRRM